MDTIKNALGYGSTEATTDQSGQEPTSGVTGDTSSGEPYDAGNKDSSTVDDQQKTTDTSDSGVSSGAPKVTDTPGNTAATGPIRPEHETDKTGVTSAHQPTSATASDKPTSSNDTSGPGPEPSVGADPSSGTQPTPKQQGADRPHEEPDQEENQAIKETKKEAEEAASVDTSGPGPKPLAETQGGATSSSGGDDDGPQKESHGEGTGEKYVKSSGMKADGGDFDAANPGAGKEADRLLETKGVHHTAPGEPKDETPQESGAADPSGKPSLKEKIKAKLHKN